MMPDQPRRRSRRPDSKQMWDESGRRGHARDRDRDRDRNLGRDGRSRRYRSRSRDRRDRHRSRSRDRNTDSDRRRNRDWDRDWDRDRDYGRDRRDRDKERERDRYRDRDEPASRGGRTNARRGVEPLRGTLVHLPERGRYSHPNASLDNTQKDGHRRSASPPITAVNSRENAPLAPSPKPGNQGENTTSNGVPHPAPVSFKVKGHDNQGQEKGADHERQASEDQPKASDVDPMDEDEGGTGSGR